jgi:signal transduction histidine kinase
MKTVLTIVLALLLGSVAGVQAQQFGTRDEAKALVERAAAFLRENGKEKAIEAFNDKSGKFVDRDLYIVMANMSDGMRVAHGFNPKMIGKSLLTFKDVEGKAYGVEILEKAKTAGSGWVDYKFTNPVTKKIADKSSYIVRVDDFVLMAGAYKEAQ